MRLSRAAHSGKPFLDRLIKIQAVKISRRQADDRRCEWSARVIHHYHGRHPLYPIALGELTWRGCFSPEIAQRGIAVDIDLEDEHLVTQIGAVLHGNQMFALGGMTVAAACLGEGDHDGYAAMARVPGGCSQIIGL